MRTSARLLLGTSTLLLALAGCGGGEPPPKTGGDLGSADSAEQAKIEKSRAKIRAADDAFEEKKYDEARKLLAEAEAMGVDTTKHEIAELREKVDKRQAKLWANEVSDQLKEKECAAAFKALAAPLASIDSEAFTKELRRLVGDASVKCVQEELDAATVAGELGRARKLVEAEETEKVLGPAASKKLRTELDATIATALEARVAPDVAAKKWGDAVAKLDAAAKSGDASEAQVAIALGSIREPVGKELEALAAKGIGARDADKKLEQFDALAKIVRWDAGAAELQKDKALPEPLRKARVALAVSAEAQRTKMKPLARPEKRWTHGTVAVAPPGMSDGESKRDLQPSPEVWVLGTTKDMALVADADPGAAGPVDRLAKSTGWVPLGRLAKEATVDWVPPDTQLTGVRVWGPLRPPEKHLELGVVTAVAGGEVTVKRLSDDKEIKVPRGSLRNGRLAPGTKLVARCEEKEQGATLDQVIPGDKLARLKCESGATTEESLASLRTKPELLPPSP